MGKVIHVGLLKLNEIAFAAKGTEPRIHRKDDAVAGVGRQNLDHAGSDTGPEFQFVRSFIGQDEDNIGIAREIELAEAEPAKRNDHHWICQIRLTLAGVLHGQLVAVGNDLVGKIAIGGQSFKDGFRK